MHDLELWIAGLAPVGIRVASLFLVAPFFAHSAIPARVKAGFVVLVTMLLAPLVRTPQRAFAPTEAFSVLAHEMAVGFLVGFSVVLIFEAVHFAGHVMGIEVGLSLVTVLDPQTNADSPVLATLMETLVLLLFLALNVHHWLLRALADSLRWIPVGTPAWNAASTEVVLRGAAAIWLVGLEVAAPAVSAVLITDITIAFLGKASPQLPVLLVGMPAKMLLGLGMLWATLRYWPRLFERWFGAALTVGEQWLRLAR